MIKHNGHVMSEMMDDVGDAMPTPGQLRALDRAMGDWLEKRGIGGQSMRLQIHTQAENARRGNRRGAK